MKQYEAVIGAMRLNGGFATLGWLYKEVLKIPGVEWKTKTPFASIRRIVQDRRFFFKIRPGLWALNELRDRLPRDITEKRSPQSDHSYYQGLLIELGNLKNFLTFAPNQDRSRMFLGKRLGDIATVDQIYPFSYEDTVKRAGTVDVVWFNERKMPAELFEVEHTTDINRALLNFLSFQDFIVTFRIVAPKPRYREFQSKVINPAFRPISARTLFASYETVAELHTKANELEAIENRWARQ